jgi:hypothetical protein
LKPRSPLRRIARFFFACFAVLLIIICMEIAGGWHCALSGQIHAPAPRPAEREAATAGIKDYARPEDDTYLSYPEWYIVWSYQEKADFQQEQLPSGFPYFAAVQQYWSSYCCISRLIRGKYPLNGGEQLMLMVIGTSFSAEYILKGIYEKTIGRLSEWTSGHESVDEDRFAYQVARDYAEFVHIRPFYEFHFAPYVKELWTSTAFWGPHPIRKWERKIFLTTDLALESVYCSLIQVATHLTYGDEPAETYAWIDNVNVEMMQQLPRLKVMKQIGPQAFIVDVPRYQEFTALASRLAEGGAQFVEIAGNSQIILSVIAPQSWSSRESGTTELFSSPILTHPGQKRAVIGCDVSSLGAVLNSLRADGVSVEHIYDY